MNKFTIIKHGLIWLAGSGAAAVFNEAAKNAKPDNLKKVDRLLYFVGTVVIGSMVMDKASTYAKGAIEDVSKIVNIDQGTDTDDNVFSTRDEAEEVLESFKDIIDSYGFATMSDYKELCGIQSLYPDSKIGWFSYENAGVKIHKDGYLLYTGPYKTINIK